MLAGAGTQYVGFAEISLVICKTSDSITGVELTLLKVLSRQLKPGEGLVCVDRKMVAYAD